MDAVPRSRHWATALALYRGKFVPLHRAVRYAWTFKTLESEDALNASQLRQLGVIEKTTRSENERRLPQGLSADVTVQDPRSGANLFTQQAADRVLGAFLLAARGLRRSARVFDTQPRKDGNAWRIAGSDEAFLLTTAKRIQGILVDVPWVYVGGTTQLGPKDAQDYVDNVAYAIPDDLKTLHKAASLNVFFADAARDLYRELIHPARAVPQL